MCFFLRELGKDVKTMEICKEAGAIVRYETIEKEIKDRTHSLDNLVNGLKRFIIGLTKKVVIANSMASIADSIFDKMPYGTILIYIGAITYTLQIYLIIYFEQIQRLFTNGRSRTYHIECFYLMQNRRK